MAGNGDNLGRVSYWIYHRDFHHVTHWAVFSTNLIGIIEDSSYDPKYQLNTSYKYENKI